MLSNILMIPPVIVAMISLYYAWTTDGQYSWILVPCLVVIAIIYVLSPQINWWWYQRHPPALPVRFIALLERSSAFYRKLSASDQERFRHRVALFKLGSDWEGKFFPEETVPPDVSLILSAQATTINFGQEKPLLNRFEKVLVFPRPFPSPTYPFEHASELYEQDDCLLFSAEQVLRAFIERRLWYNVGLHEYARVFVLTNPDKAWPSYDDSTWSKLESVSGMPRQHVESVIGLESVDILPVVIHHFFVFPDEFSAAFPEEAVRLAHLFMVR